jgi:hypothetical protein
MSCYCQKNSVNFEGVTNSPLDLGSGREIRNLGRHEGSDDNTEVTWILAEEAKIDLDLDLENRHRHRHGIFQLPCQTPTTQKPLSGGLSGEQGRSISSNEDKAPSAKHIGWTKNERCGLAKLVHAGRSASASHWWWIESRN